MDWRDIISDDRIRYSQTWSSEFINSKLNRKVDVSQYQSVLAAIAAPKNTVDGGASDGTQFTYVDCGASSSTFPFTMKLDGGSSG